MNSFADLCFTTYLFNVISVESFHSSKIAVVLEERIYLHQSQCPRSLSAVTALGLAVSAGGRRANQKLQTSPRSATELSSRHTPRKYFSSSTKIFPSFLSAVSPGHQPPACSEWLVHNGEEVRLMGS